MLTSLQLLDNLEEFEQGPLVRTRIPTKIIDQLQRELSLNTQAQTKVGIEVHLQSKLFVPITMNTRMQTATNIRAAHVSHYYKLPGV